jgi:hypothetical protein
VYSVESHRHFGGTCRLHLHRQISQIKSQNERKEQAYLCWLTVSWWFEDQRIMQNTKGEFTKDVYSILGPPPSRESRKKLPEQGKYAAYDTVGLKSRRRGWKHSALCFPPHKIWVMCPHGLSPAIPSPFQPPPPVHTAIKRVGKGNKSLLGQKQK